MVAPRRPRRKRRTIDTLLPKKKTPRRTQKWKSLRHIVQEYSSDISSLKHQMNVFRAHHSINSFLDPKDLKPGVLNAITYAEMNRNLSKLRIARANTIFEWAKKNNSTITKGFMRGVIREMDTQKERIEQNPWTQSSSRSALQLAESIVHNLAARDIFTEKRDRADKRRQELSRIHVKRRRALRRKALRMELGRVESYLEALSMQVKLYKLHGIHLRGRTLAGIGGDIRTLRQHEKKVLEQLGEIGD